MKRSSRKRGTIASRLDALENTSEAQRDQFREILARAIANLPAADQVLMAAGEWRTIHDDDPDAWIRLSAVIEQASAQRNWSLTADDLLL